MDQALIVRAFYELRGLIVDLDALLDGEEHQALRAVVATLTELERLAQVGYAAEQACKDA